MTEQEIRTKVIKALECCAAMSGDECRECPYSKECRDTDLPYGMPHLAADVLALLKAQESRVMTLEEAKSASGYVIVQSRSCNILELQLIKDGFVYDSFTVPVAVDDLWWEGYNKYWRLWTSVQTDAQMEAVKWDG